MSLLLLFRSRRGGDTHDGSAGDDSNIAVSILGKESKGVRKTKETQDVTITMQGIKDVVRQRKIASELSKVVEANIDRLAMAKNLADFLVLVQLLRSEHSTLAHWTDDDLLTILLLSSE